MAGTLFSYNDVTLSDITSMEFSQKPCFSDDNTTYLYDEFKIRVKGLFNRAVLPADPINTEEPSQTHARIRACLNQPRKRLVYQDANGNILTSPPAPVCGEDFIDCKNGPIPGTLLVDQMTPTTWHIQFEVTTWITACCNDNCTLPWVSHRWSETIDYDKDFKSKITRKGRLIFRSDLIATLENNGLITLKPDQNSFRQVVYGACPLRPRFSRTSSFTAQEDGLAVDYTITDEELYAVPLPGITRFEANYACITEKAAVNVEEMRVRVFGDNNAQKATLYQAAAKIMSACISNQPQVKMIMGARLGHALHENTVELSVSTIKQKHETTLLGLQLGAAGAPAAPGLDPGGANSGSAPFNQMPNPGLRGTAGLVLTAAALRDPCLDIAIQQGEFAGPIAAPPQGQGAGNGMTEINVVPVLPNQVTFLSTPELAAGFYVKSFIDIDYETDYHTLQMPVASSAATTCSFAVVANPTCRKIVKYEIEKVGDQPTMPAAQSSDPNEVLLHSDIMPAAVDLEADAYNKRWKVMGKYVYGIKNCSLVKPYAGKVPYLSDNFVETELSANKFVTGLTSPSGPGSGSISYPIIP